MNALAFWFAAAVMAAVALFAPGGELKWWGLAAFSLLWLPLAHYGYGFYDELTAGKR